MRPEAGLQALAQASQQDRRLGLLVRAADSSGARLARQSRRAGYSMGGSHEEQADDRDANRGLLAARSAAGAGGAGVQARERATRRRVN